MSYHCTIPHHHEYEMTFTLAVVFSAASMCARLTLQEIFEEDRSAPVLMHDSSPHPLSMAYVKKLHENAQVHRVQIGMTCFMSGI
jgi:hypothetical protein